MALSPQARSGNIATLPLIVFVGYAAGAQVGMLLRLPDAVTSVVWPPNAILTTALLFVAPRYWWIAIGSALPAHLLIELGAWPLPLVLGLFVTNCTEAIIAASTVRWFSDAPSRLDTLKRVGVFLAGVALLAPFVSSFFDAAVASRLGGQDYWTVWNRRFPSNVLGAIAIVPALAGVANSSYRQLQEWPRRQWFKALKIAAGLAIVGIVVATDGLGLGIRGVSLTLFLPFLIWAAVSFGTTGAGLSLFATVVVAVETALYGGGMFEQFPPDERVRVLQLALIVTGVPVICLAALVEERRQVEKALRVSDSLKSAILLSLPNHVAVLDADGHVIAVNDRWPRRARENRGSSEGASGVEASYRDVCAARPGQEDGDAISAFEGIRDVLQGRRTAFIMEYLCRSGGHESWWLMRVVPLRRPDGGAVVTHTETTERRRAEMDARRSREELAHLSRVFVLGELTASLSHQLSQPLTAIIGNAQAGRRFLDATPPNILEVRDILGDVVADATRASDIVRGLRDMMRKSSTEHQPVDVNEIVRETSNIVGSDALMRDVYLQVEMSQSLPYVNGDPVQLQQVVLNLLLNAIEAVAGHAAAAVRVVSIRTATSAGGEVTIFVCDTGPGLPASADDIIFEPFFTTKPSGIGLGLSIARSIIEAHGGTLNGSNRPSGGAVFQLTLPPA